MTKFTGREKFLLRCAGADLGTMQECTSSEVNRYLIIGTGVLIPSVLSLFTCGYMIFLVSGSLVASVCLAPVWAWVIFTIDRAIVANTVSRKITVSILLRFIMAGFISILISQPMELLAFRDVIKNQRRIELETKKDSAARKLDSMILKKENQLDTMESIHQKMFNGVVTETANGDPEHRRESGYGRVARTLDTLDQRFLAYNVSKKEKIYELLDTLKRQRAEVRQGVEKTDPNGMIGELELLYDAEALHKIVRAGVILISLFFLVLELLPVLIKLDGNSSSPDLYNQVREKYNAACLAAHEGIQDKKQKLFEKEQMLLLHQRVDQIDLLVRKNKIKEFAKMHTFFNAVLKTTREEMENTKSEIIRKVKNDAFRDQLLNQVLRLFSEFSKALEKLISNVVKNMDVHDK